MKFAYHGHHTGEKIGVDPGHLDGHSRPLVNPSLVPADSPRALFIITADKPFVLNHKNHELGLNWVCDFMCAGSGKNFRGLDRELLPPEGTKVGVGIEFPAKKKTEAKP